MTDEELKKLLVQRKAKAGVSGMGKRGNILYDSGEVRVCIEGRTLLNLSSGDVLGVRHDALIIQKTKENPKMLKDDPCESSRPQNTRDLYPKLEKEISCFLQTEDSILYPSSAAVHTGLFRNLLTEEDVVLSDMQNPGTITDGIRLCSAKHYRYRHRDMSDLECLLKMTSEHQLRLIVTAGVFATNGRAAPLAQLCALAETYGALVVVDDTCGIGIMGKKGRGSPAHCGVENRVDLTTGSLSGAIGAALGGFVSGRKLLTDWLRRNLHADRYMAPLPSEIVSEAIRCVEIICQGDDLREKLFRNVDFFREGLIQMGYIVPPGRHPIIPVLIDGVEQSRVLADSLYKAGILVETMTPPWVSESDAGIRVQISAAHSTDELSLALDQFYAAGKSFDLLMPV